jgi:hypothetical protein
MAAPKSLARRQPGLSRVPPSSARDQNHFGEFPGQIALVSAMPALPQEKIVDPTQHQIDLKLSRNLSGDGRFVILISCVRIKSGCRRISYVRRPAGRTKANSEASSKASEGFAFGVQPINRLLPLSGGKSSRALPGRCRKIIRVVREQCRGGIAIEGKRRVGTGCVYSGRSQTPGAEYATKRIIPNGLMTQCWK